MKSYLGPDIDEDPVVERHARATILSHLVMMVEKRAVGLLRRGPSWEPVAERWRRVARELRQKFGGTYVQ